jgi:AraC-like DNA-binding protein
MEGALRVAPLLVLLRLLADHKLDVHALIRGAGCDPAQFSDPENNIDFLAVGRLLDHVATATRLPYPGLEFGRLAGLDVLGPLGNAIRFAPDVGTALRALMLHFHLHDRGAVPTLWESRGRSMFGYTLYCPDIRGVDHIYDAALAISYNVLAELVGKKWKCIEVHMFRDPPTDEKPFREHFRSKMRFRTEHAAIVFPATCLSEPLDGADPFAYALALRKLEDMDAATENRLLSNKVRRVLYRKLIGEGGTSGIVLNDIAELFELHPRTFNRRLQVEGMTFNKLLTETRHKTALQLLRDTHLLIRDIAFLLGYADTACFNRAFRRWSGTTASKWRATNSTDQEKVRVS